MEIFGLTIAPVILNTLGIILGGNLFCLVIFYLMDQKKQTEMSKELYLRTRSWLYIALGIAALVILPPIVGTVLLAYISFVALREMFSISGLREADRMALIAAYTAVPIQYFLAYSQSLKLFNSFIPITMAIVIPFILVVNGKTEKIGRSMALIPSIMILTIFMLSHLALLFNMEIEGFDVGYAGLILFLVILTALNDVFQFTWGKLLGKHKITPSVSPNKTWEGFIGGILTTGALGALIHFLTPLSALEAGITGFILGIIGFAGDILVSAIKRDLKIKDTDDLIPGHGGAMDRMDSILLTAPVFYQLLNFFLTHPIG